MNEGIVVGPLVKLNQKKRVLYAMDADELTMMRPQSEISGKEAMIADSYRREMSLYGLSFLGVTDPYDGIFLDEEFLNQKDLIGWLRAQYTKLGLKITETVHFSKIGSFYSNAKDLFSKELLYDALVTTSFSHTLEEKFNIGEKLTVSKILNKKDSLPNLATKYKFTTPKSFVVESKKDITRINSFFIEKDFPIFIKSNGLGGGLNVLRVTSPAELPEEIIVPSLVQASVPPNSIEVSSSWLLSSKECSLLNFRAQLVNNGYVYGCMFHPGLTPSPKQLKTITTAANGIKTEGYAATEDFGLIVGFDSFIVDDDLSIIEINARYLDSTRYELLLKKLNILGRITAVPITDTINIDDLQKFKDFVEKNLYGSTPGPFSIIPVSFSAYTENNEIAVSFIVCESVEAFFSELQQIFSTESFKFLPEAVAAFTAIKKTLDL